MYEWIYTIQKMIEFIDDNMLNNPSLKEISKQVGYSPCYCSSQFRLIMGTNIKSYMAKRRLYMAAVDIRDTDKRIIDIAIEYGYFGQNSLTRAFKDFYGCTPAVYRKNPSSILISMNTIQIANKNYIKTGGFIMDGKSAIRGWFLTGASPQKYQLYLDEKVYNTGTKSACLKSVSDECDDNDFGTIMQTFSAKNFLEKRVRFSGFVKSQNVAGWCGLWMRIDGASATEMLKFDNMQNRSIQGTTEWKQYSCVLDVPDNATVINIGMLLTGEGQVWLDNVSFQEVDYNTPTTDAGSALPDYPKNLSFEEIVE